MATYLVFDLYGPFVSFGDVAVGDYRPTYSYPSKSAVLGLLAASLGFRRKDEDRLKALDDDLRIAVLVLHSGKLLRDFHTIQVPPDVQMKRRTIVTRKDELSLKKQNTIISTRDYRMDSYYRVAVWSASGVFDLVKLQEALSYPKFSPYLGRKSCPPALPFKAEVIDSDDVCKALTIPGFNGDLLQIIPKLDRNASYMLYSETLPKKSEGTIMIVTKNDRLVSRKSWQYGERKEFIQYVGGENVFQQNT
nr:type I-E CRISPR-associated protein Cas5/CasD [uncultured Sphaerochaeta sp.]